MSQHFVRFLPARVIAATLIFGVTFALYAARPQQAQQVAAAVQAKRALTHQDYDAWRSINGATLSRDGKWLGYAALPQDGDGEIIIKNLATGAEWRAPRGWRPPAPPPDLSDPTAAQNFIAAQGRIGRPTFTADARFAVFTIEPLKAEVLQARKEKKAPDAMPKNALGLMDLITGQVTRIERVKNFQVPDEGAGWLAYQLEAKVEAKLEEKKPEAEAAKPSNDEGAEDFQQRRGGAAPGAAGTARGGGRKEFGTDLVLRKLSDGTERTFSDALDYSFSKDAKTLLYTVSAKAEEKNGLFAVVPGTDGATELLSGKGKYTRLTWDEDQTQLAFFSDRDDAAAKQPKFKIYHWKRSGGTGTKAAEVVSNTIAGFRSGMVISERGGLNFTQDGSRLFLGVAPPPEPEKEGNETPAEEKVVVDLWHWKDDLIQPMQKVRAAQELNRSYRSIYHIADKKLVQLADETMESITPSRNGLWAIGTDERPYRQLIGYESFGGKNDVYLVNTQDGARKQLLKAHRGGASLSPNAKYALFYDGKHWNTISLPDGKITNLTDKLNVAFWQEDDDHPDTPPPHGNAGWVKDDKYVLLYDQYDIWQIAPDGSSAKNLTDGMGRKEKTEFRYARLDPEERFIDPAKPLLLRAEAEWTRDSGFYRDRVDGAAPEKLMMAAKSFGQPTKAKDADVVMLTASRFDEYPDVQITDSSFKSLKKITNEGAQKDKFTWGKAELIRFKNTDGVALSASLIKPDNFDPNKKYPLMVYIYEKLSDGVHRFVNPSPGTSINPTFYASNGYLVLQPDIVYDIGYPGPSALKCVLPAVQALVDKGFVNEDAIGIQGHSWGGYQIAYMVTQTNRFKAAAPGALVANMTSAYSGIRWGSGLPRQAQYEHTQSRIGGSLWEQLPRFMENSPIFRVDRVQTPILMLHNDEDDAVPWYQGIEYYLGLRRLNKEAYMFNYNGEKHGLRQRQNQKDYTRRLQEFFDHKLKGAPAPEWMNKGIRYVDREKEKEKYKTASDVANKQ